MAERTVIDCGNMSVYPMDGAVCIDGKQVYLPMRQYQLLMLLLRHEGKPVSVDYIKDALWNGHTHNITPFCLISRLRKNIGFERIISANGSGYALKMSGDVYPS